MPSHPNHPTHKPVVGVVPLFDEARESIWMIPGYMDMLVACGALPVILPFVSEPRDVERQLELVDGVLVTGGQDVSPYLYGERALPECGTPYAKRDLLDQELIRQCRATRMPLLGICRGIQIINVTYGGTLWQDLPSQRPSDLDHAMRPPYDRVAHEVTFKPGSRLADAMGCNRLGVNSYHHQGVKDVAPGLEAVAWATDGLVEALRDPTQDFMLGVQWHPELSWRVDPHQKHLVSAFVAAARNHYQHRRG